jgi:GNAT superfamily N-acetyltransferase
MTYDAHMLAAVAGERRQSLYSEAAAVRRVKLARQRSRPAELGGVLIRPIRSSDGAGLREGFARLGPQSRELRFLSPKPALSAAEVAYFTEVDHVMHEALVAVDPMAGVGLGVARYIRDPKAPQVADVSVTVVDEWQRRGVGTQLVQQLMRRARKGGICRFTALVSTDNVGVRRLLRRVSSDVVLVERDSTTLSYEIPLTPCCEPCS